MKCFQIYKEGVLIINEDKEYKDTLSNFLLDSGLSDAFPTFIVYDDYQGQCMVEGELKEYPNAKYEELISNIDTYIAAKEKRTYIPPKESTAEEKLQMEANSTRANLQTMAINAMMLSLAGNDLADAKREYQTGLMSISDDVALKIPDVFPSWSDDGVEYKKDTKLTYNGVLYKVLQDHTSQASWTPDAAPSLFAKVLVSDDGTPQEWQQPDSTNAYTTGDRVTFEGHIYESLIDNNVWSPSAYPQGWKLINEGEE